MRSSRVREFDFDTRLRNLGVAIIYGTLIDDYTVDEKFRAHLWQSIISSSQRNQTSQDAHTSTS